MLKYICITLLLFLPLQEPKAESITVGTALENYVYPGFSSIEQDTIHLNQVLYNGRKWIGIYYGVYGTEFMIDREWKTGDLTINGTTFKGIPLKYDIYNDQLLTNYRNIRVLILNRELVESFTIYSGNESHTFLNRDGSEGLSGYYEVFYENNTALYKKWRKKRVEFAIDGMYDEFQSDNVLLLVKDGVVHELKKRKTFMKVLSDHKDEVNDFTRNSHIRPDFQMPQSLIRILEFYDNLNTL